MVTGESIVEKRNPNGHNLPVEIVDEILSWLPVKSLCRFRCVSKPWLYLISDPGFVKKHRDRAIQNENVFHQRQRVIYTNHPLSTKWRPNFSIYSLDLNASSENYGLVVPTKLNHVFDEGNFVIDWMAHCNGLLLCNLFGIGLYLLNPATKESKHVPRPRYLQDYGCPNNLFGFGFDNDDYKVVNGEIYMNNRDDFVTVFNVYTLKTSSWRRIEKQFPYNKPRSYEAILLNGGLHWLMYRLGGGSLMIVSLHLAEEEVREIQLPVGRRIRDNRIVLGVFRGNKLFISGRRKFWWYDEIWVMMDYGVRESWTKMRVFIPHCTLSRFCLWNNSHDLYVDNNSLAAYNCTANDSLVISGIGEVGSVGMYFESLVSLNSRDGDHEPTPQKPIQDPSQFRIVNFPFHTHTSLDPIGFSADEGYIPYDDDGDFFYAFHHDDDIVSELMDPFLPAY